MHVQERKLIPSSVVDEIVSLNELDAELHKHAKFLFAKQQRQFTLSTLPQVLHMDRMSFQSDCLPGAILRFKLWRFKVRND